jgi:peptide-methionine (S)-S-oxide reductase
MANTQKATFASGCFWHPQQAFKKIDGVVSAVAGYTNGDMDDPTYEDVCNKDTGHAEAVQVEYDPDKISYDELLAEFWKMHDPTQLNKQGADVGDQYRSAVFFHDDAQREVAEKSMEDMELNGPHDDPIVTEITKADTFYPAEEYHQDYYDKQGIDSCN